MTESEKELKSLLMNVKDESENLGLKLKIQKTKIMAFSPTTAWQIDAETMETVTGFTFLRSKITEDSDFSRERKRRLLLGKKAMTNQDSMLKAEILLCRQRSVQSKIPFFQQSCMDVRVGLEGKLPAETLMLLDCGLGEDS